jgi:hypothetical protein
VQLQERVKRCWQFLNDERVVAAIAVLLLVALFIAGHLVDIP